MSDVNKLLRDIALTFLAGLVIGVLNLKVGPTHISWDAFRTVLDDALRAGLLVPMSAALAPFYPEYGVGSNKVAPPLVSTPQPTIAQSLSVPVTPTQEPPDYLQPQI